MRAWLVKLVMRWAYGCINDGRPEPVLRLLADDVILRFPGNNRWGRTYRGKAEVEAFMRELISLGLRFEVHDVLVKGWPWKMTVAVVLSDSKRDDNGAIVYSNRAVEIWISRWGRIAAGELFEDTEKATAFDAALTARAASA